MNPDIYAKAAETIASSRHLIAFTGAGISVESGVPPFRGPGGIWNHYDPNRLEIDYFKHSPLQSWETIREIFYRYFNQADPNPAHRILAEFEHTGILKTIITQNIDNLHQAAGSQNVIEFHGNSNYLICMTCGSRVPVRPELIEMIPPKCKDCGGILKPDFVFFGEPIPEQAYHASMRAALQADVVLVIGSTGEVMPACYVPITAKEHGATVIEINIQSSRFTSSITDIYIADQAGAGMQKIKQHLHPQAGSTPSNRSE